jgi:hypothetical protein
MHGTMSLKCNNQISQGQSTQRAKIIHVLVKVSNENTL